MTVRIGALQADAWAGLVLSPAPGEGFAFRFAVEKDGAVADLDDLFWLTHDVGPHAPDGSYARMAFDVQLPFGLGKDTPVLSREGRHAGLVVEWGRVGQSGVGGRVTAGFVGTILVRAYFPWDWEGAWRPAGEGAAVGVTASGASAVGLRVDRPAAATAEPDGTVVFRVPVARGDVLGFAAALGEDGERALGGTRGISLDVLDAAADAYEARRTRVSGHLEGLAASITNNLHWMVLLQPETGRTYTPAGRRWIFPAAPERRREAGGERDHWTVFGWDSYFNALELAVEAPEAARETLLAGLRTAYPNGCVPNWRGRFGGTPDRSQPPVGSLAALKLHLRHPDRATLEAAYPLLAAWSRWWSGEHDGRLRRSPGPRGLFTWGSDRDLIDPLCPPWERDVDVRQLAAWESGQDDLPTWDEAEPSPGTGCLALDPVDANAYRVLDLECLAGIADELGLGDDAAAHRRSADELRARVNEHLWDADRETYADRRWDGTFTPCRTASHFLVLTAGIAPADRADRMAEHLASSRFWGEWVVPTIGRDDPRFEQQQYWRGTIWPPINYLIHMGLARYRFDALAGELAASSARMFLGSRRATGLCRENFDSRTGEGCAQRHQSWGPLFALTALEEMADLTPWDGGGLRVGGLRAAGASELTNLRIREGEVLRIATAPDSLRAWVDGREVVEARGAVVLRNLTAGPERFAAETSSETDVELRVGLEGERWSGIVDGRREELDAPRVRLGAGAHRVEVRAVR